MNDTKPLFIDGIIYSLQKHGGISVLFGEIVKRLPQDYFRLSRTDKMASVLRYLDVLTPNGTKIFHSTYYRLPLDKKINVISTVHDFTYERFSHGLPKFVHSQQKKRAVLGSDLIVCVSNNTKEDLLYYYGDSLESKAVVIHNAASAGFKPLQNVAKRNQVLFVGSRVSYKNFINTVSAVALVPNVSLRCVGGGAFSDEELVLLNASLPNRFSHAGFITEEELNYEYNASLCLIYPSLYEGFGIPVIEAMSAGCPVIAMNSSSIPEVAGDSALLLDRGDCDEIAHFISRIVNDSSLVSTLIAKGFEQARLFSWDSNYDSLKKLYDSFL